jgi:hypothetical protein
MVLIKLKHNVQRRYLRGGIEFFFQIFDTLKKGGAPISSSPPPPPISKRDNASGPVPQQSEISVQLLDKV